MTDEEKFVIDLVLTQDEIDGINRVSVENVHYPDRQKVTRGLCTLGDRRSSIWSVRSSASTTTTAYS